MTRAARNNGVHLEFDIPFDQLGFQGKPFKEARNGGNRSIDICEDWLGVVNGRETFPFHLLCFLYSLLRKNVDQFVLLRMTSPERCGGNDIILFQHLSPS